jgi:hypothetical protein
MEPHQYGSNMASMWHQCGSNTPVSPATPSSEAKHASSSEAKHTPSSGKKG